MWLYILKNIWQDDKKSKDDFISSNSSLGVTANSANEGLQTISLDPHFYHVENVSVFGRERDEM